MPRRGNLQLQLREHHRHILLHRELLGVIRIAGIEQAVRLVGDLNEAPRMDTGNEDGTQRAAETARAVGRVGHLVRVEHRGRAVGLNDPRRDQLCRNGGRILRQFIVRPAGHGILALNIDALQQHTLRCAIVANVITQPLLEHDRAESTVIRHLRRLGDETLRFVRGRLRFPLRVRLVNVDLDIVDVDQLHRVATARRLRRVVRRQVDTKRRFQYLAGRGITQPRMFAGREAELRVRLARQVCGTRGQLLPRRLRVFLQRGGPLLRIARQVDLPRCRRGGKHLARLAEKNRHERAGITGPHENELPRRHRIERGFQVSGLQARP